MTKQKSTYYYKLFRVKRMDGRVTTISMNPILAAKASQVMGGLKPVGKIVRDTALTYKEGLGMGRNCSGFVSATLLNEVKKAQESRKLEHAKACHA